MIAAADLVRPAAILQLQVLGEKVGVPVLYPRDKRSNKSCKRGPKKRQKSGQYDVLIVDTSGRIAPR